MADPHTPSSPPGGTFAARLREVLHALRQFPRTALLVWEAGRKTAIGLAAVMLFSSAPPAALAWVGKLIVDAVVKAARTRDPTDARRVFTLVLLELGIVSVQLGLSRLSAYLREVLRQSLGNHVNVRILEKASELELRHFEDAEVYDKLQRARREASSRPFSLVLGVVSIVQQALLLVFDSALLTRLSPWAMLAILAASIPALVAEVRFSGASFRLNTWRAPETRKQSYLEWILTRDSHVKEVKAFGLTNLFLARYRAFFDKFFEEDRVLARRRAIFGLLFGALSLVPFYVGYLSMSGRAAIAEITLGDLTLYLTVFRQAQGALQSLLSVLSDLYEDGLFMRNLFEYLSIEATGERRRGTVSPVLPRGRPLDLEIREVGFRYPGQEGWVLRGVDLKLPAGQKLALCGDNGSGKSTLVKLILRLYEPTEGAIRYGGVDLRDLDPSELRSRISTVFQDYVRYQLTVAENVGLGDIAQLADRMAIEQATAEAGAFGDGAGRGGFVGELPQGFDTMLGGWFEKGHELSAGQWQKLAIARAFLRKSELLILDEPSASLDAEAEAELFGRLRALASAQSAILISHRFSTIRLADQIALLRSGRVAELGTHDQLLAQGGRYAELFALQATGYK